MPTSTSRRDLLALLAVVPLMACVRRVDASLPGAPTSPQAIVQAARGRSAPFALQGRFTVRLEGPGVAGTTKGALVLGQPDLFRVEVHSPVGPPMMVLASDGKALNAWIAKGNRFFRGDDAAAVLDQLTRGAVNLSDVNQVLTGGLPLHDAPVHDLAQDPDGLVRLSMDGPEGVQVHARLDPSTGLLASLEVVAGPDTFAPGLNLPVSLVLVEILSTMRAGRDRLPESIRMRLPTMGWTVSLDFLSWDELGQIPQVFSLAPPPGASEQELVAALRALAEGGPAGRGD